MSHWFWRVLWSVIAVAVGVAATLWVYKKQSYKALSYRVVSVSPLGPLQARSFTDLRLMKGDKQIERPFLMTIQISNTGDLDIRATDFEVPITIRPLGLGLSGGRIVDMIGATEKGAAFSKFTIPYKSLASYAPEIVDARVATTTPPKIPVELEIVGHDLRIKPLLLNVGDELTVESLINGDVAGVAVGGRIAGVRQIIEERRVEAAATDERRLGRLAFRGAVLTTLAMVLAAFAGSITLTRTKGGSSDAVSVPPGFTISLLAAIGIATVCLLVFALWNSARDFFDYLLGLVLLLMVCASPIIWLRSRMKS
jgi:hypothetical protein